MLREELDERLQQLRPGNRQGGDETPGQLQGSASPEDGRPEGRGAEKEASMLDPSLVSLEKEALERLGAVSLQHQDKLEEHTLEIQSLQTGLQSSEREHGE